MSSADVNSKNERGVYRMKRIFALLLSLVMLLGTCAFAEEAAAAHSYTLSDMVVTYMDQVFDLSNVALEMDVSEDGGLLHIDENGDSAAEIGVTKVDNLYVLHMAGTTAGHKDFAVDPVAYVERTLREGIDGLVSLLQGIDTHDAAQKFVDFLERPMPEAVEPEAPVEAPEEEPGTITIDLSSLSIEGDIMGALEACVSEQGITAVDGSNGIPAGDYDVTSFCMDDETLADLLDMVQVDGKPIGVGDAIRESGAELTLNVTSYSSEAAEAFDFSAIYVIDGETFDFHGLAVTTPAEDGSSTAFTFEFKLNDQVATVQFTTSNGASEEQFTPASVNLDEAVMLHEMADEEAVSALSDAFNALMNDAITPILNPVMATLMAGVDMSGVPEDAPAG